MKLEVLDITRREDHRPHDSNSQVLSMRVTSISERHFSQKGFDLGTGTLPYSL